MVRCCSSEKEEEPRDIGTFFVFEFEKKKKKKKFGAKKGKREF
jgi:hypothetical protein